MWQPSSSNPALNNDEAFQQYYGEMAGTKPQTATLQGVVNKTGLLIAMAMVAGAGGYALVSQFPATLWITWIAGLVITIGLYFVIFGNPARAKYLAPVYALVEGCFLGAFTGFIEAKLASAGVAVTGGVAVQAFVITISAMVAMLGLYHFKILKPTKMFVSVVTTMAVAIGVTYLLSFVMAMFGAQMPFLSLGSAAQGGTPALIGLGLNVLILGVASLFLILDFKLIEDLVARGAPKDLEWYGGFALLVTLAWIYFEAVKLVYRLAMLTRD